MRKPTPLSIPDNSWSRAFVGYLVTSNLLIFCRSSVPLLVWASEQGHAAVVGMLLEAGADNEAKGKVRRKDRGKEDKLERVNEGKGEAGGGVR